MTDKRGDAEGGNLYGEEKGDPHNIYTFGESRRSNPKAKVWSCLRKKMKPLKCGG